MRWASVLACLLFIPAAMAGTMDDPEIADASGDSIDDIDDIVRVWIADDVVVDSAGRDSLLISLDLAADDPDMSSLFALHDRIRVGFTGAWEGAPGPEMYVIFQPNLGTTSQTGEDRFFCKFGNAAAGGSADITEEKDMDEGEWDGKHFECILPIEYIGGDAARGGTIQNLVAEYQVVQRGPTNGGDAAGVQKVTVDRAPDSGFGREYLVPALPEPVPDIVFQNLTELPYINETLEAFTGIIAYNYTGLGPFFLDANITEGAFELNVTVRAADGEPQEVLVWNGTGGSADTGLRRVCVDEAIQPVDCQYTFTYTFSEFVGSYSIDLLAEASEPIDGNATELDDHDHEGHDHGNETEEPLDTPEAGKESPLGIVPLVIAALVVLARRR